MFGKMLSGPVHLGNLCLMITCQKYLFDGSLFRKKLFMEHFFPFNVHISMFDTFSLLFSNM